MGLPRMHFLENPYQWKPRNSLIWNYSRVLGEKDLRTVWHTHTLLIFLSTKVLDPLIILEHDLSVLRTWPISRLLSWPSPVLFYHHRCYFYDSLRNLPLRALLSALTLSSHPALLSLVSSCLSLILSIPAFHDVATSYQSLLLPWVNTPSHSHTHVPFLCSIFLHQIPDETPL